MNNRSVVSASPPMRMELNLENFLVTIISTWTALTSGCILMLLALFASSTFWLQINIKFRTNISAWRISRFGLYCALVCRNLSASYCHFFCLYFLWFYSFFTSWCSETVCLRSCTNEQKFILVIDSLCKGSIIL